jgi:uncharacterized membrane protein
MLKNVTWVLKIFLGYTILSASVFLMLRISTNYLAFQDNVQFLVFKQDYLNIKIWKFAFYTHAFSAVICLFAGFTQFSSELTIQYPRLHRLLGWIYVLNILIINFPAALIMSIYANGGLLTKLAFSILNLLWFVFTFKAVKFAIQGNISLHRKFMIRSFALTFSAITLRTWKVILTNTSVIDADDIYMTEAWLGFLPNLILAEIWIRYFGSNVETD